MRKIIVIIACIVSLLIVNYAIYSKEKHLSEDQMVSLKLAPLDPRSLMQGDYMALRFDIANTAHNAVRETSVSPDSYSIDYDGLLVVHVDDNHLATFVRLANDQELMQDELNIKFRIRSGVVMFATNAFFFEEGKAALYEQAKYGMFKVNNTGELILTGLQDENFVLLDDEI